MRSIYTLEDKIAQSLSYMTTSLAPAQVLGQHGRGRFLMTVALSAQLELQPDLNSTFDDRGLVFFSSMLSAAAAHCWTSDEPQHRIEPLSQTRSGT